MKIELFEGICDKCGQTVITSCDAVVICPLCGRAFLMDVSDLEHVPEQAAV